MADNNTTTVSLAGAVSGMVGGFTTIICLTFAHFGWTIPGEGTAAMVGILTPIIHYICVKYGSNNFVSAPAPAVNVTVVPKANT